MERHHYEPGDEYDPDRFSPEGNPSFRLFLAVLGGLGRYFRYEVHGLEHVPAEGGALVITPHSTVSVDGLLLGRAIWQRTGRWPRPLADHLLFEIPYLRELGCETGFLDGRPANALRTLRKGHLCLVMPGGAREAWKASRRDYRVEWSDHTGYVKVALQAGVPLVPAVCVGAEEAYRVPVETFPFAEERLGVRLPLLPPFGIGLLPIPTKFTAYVGRPLALPFGPEAAADAALVARLHALVVGHVQALVDDALTRRRSRWF